MTSLIPSAHVQVSRRFVSGSGRGRLQVSGDVLGPIFPGGSPVDFSSCFPTGNGRFAKGSELHAFNLAANTWQLHYLRLTNQLPRLPRLSRAVFEKLNLEYCSLLRRLSPQGWFSNWDSRSPSVWLTAWALRQMAHAAFQEWEPFIYIDPFVSHYRTTVGRANLIIPL